MSKGLATALILGAAVMVAACDDADESDGEAAAPPPKVTVAEAGPREIRDASRFVGQTAAVDRAGLTPRVKGFLEERAVLDGDVVDEGTVLFRIERATYEATLAQAKADVAQAQAELALAEIELERDTELLASDTIAQARYDSTLAIRDSTTAQVEAGEARVRQAELDLSYTDIHAPFDGRIGRIDFSVGDVVSPETGPIATLVRIKPIYVEFSLSEQVYLTLLGQVEGDLATNVDPEQSPPVTLMLPNGEPFDEVGQIVFIDNQINPQTGTIALRARFDNERGLLAPGVFVTTEISSQESETRTVVPQVAVQRDQKGAFVLAVTAEGTVEQKYVDLGDSVDGDVVVEGGLEDGEAVIVEGLQRVRPGVPVEPVMAAAPAEG